MPLVRPTAPATAPTSAEREPVTLPNEDEVREMLHSLLDRPVLVHRVFTPFESPELGEIALMVDDEGTLAAIAVADLSLAAASAAALALVPNDAVTAAVEAGELSELLQENYYEVINIVSSLFNGNPERHVRLTTTHRVGDTDLDATVTQRLADGAGVHWFTVDIDGYGNGVFAVAPIA